MISIRREITAIESGEGEQTPVLRFAPYTIKALTTDHWMHTFSRQQAAFPIDSLKKDRYWPPVGRIDNVYGDRNLVCSCPPVSEYKDAPTEAA